MRGGLKEILPEPISDASEAILLDLMKAKMRGAAALSVRLLQAMEARFGAEARQVVRELAAGREPEPRPDAGDPRQDLQTFCANLDRGVVGSHAWERVADEPDRIAYHYTRCMWAEVFRELGELELGMVICAGDDPVVRSWNPRLGFRRTQVLMQGDPVCDHVFLVEDEAVADDEP